MSYTFDSEVYPGFVSYVLSCISSPFQSSFLQFALVSSSLAIGSWIVLFVSSTCNSFDSTEVLTEPFFPFPFFTCFQISSIPSNIWKQNNLYAGYFNEKSDT